MQSYKSVGKSYLNKMRPKYSIVEYRCECLLRGKKKKQILEMFSFGSADCLELARFYESIYSYVGM